MNEISNKHQNDDKRLVAITTQYSGPLPPPEILAQFEQIIPGAAERILRMAEEQSAHRRSLEAIVIKSDISRSKAGQLLGFIIAITGLLIAGLVSVFGNTVAGSIIGVSTLTSIVGVFMYGYKSREAERNEKARNDK